MRIEENRIGNILIARVVDTRIATDSSPHLKAQIAEYINNGDRSIVLDLAGVTFVDSSGLGALVASLRAMGSDGNLVISGVRGAVASLFKLTRMDKVFRMYESPDEAVEALSNDREH
jgi:anti-sigma B factor antagonist